MQHTYCPHGTLIEFCGLCSTHHHQLPLEYEARPVSTAVQTNVAGHSSSLPVFSNNPYYNPRIPYPQQIATTWTCGACGCKTNTNTPSSVSCSVCGTPRPRGAASRGLSLAVTCPRCHTVSAFLQGTQFGQCPSCRFTFGIPGQGQPPRTNNQWPPPAADIVRHMGPPVGVYNCPQCTLECSVLEKRCSVCEYPNPSPRYLPHEIPPEMVYRPPATEQQPPSSAVAPRPPETGRNTSRVIPSVSQPKAQGPRSSDEDGEEMKTLNPRVEAPPLTGWCCSICTFNNEGTARICSMCTAPQGVGQSPAPLDMQHLQPVAPPSRPRNALDDLFATSAQSAPVLHTVDEFGDFLPAPLSHAPHALVVVPGFRNNDATVTFEVRRTARGLDAMAVIEPLSGPITDVVLQVAVPKTTTLELQSLSSTSAVPGQKITQGLKIVTAVPELAVKIKFGYVTARGEAEEHIFLVRHGVA